LDKNLVPTEGKRTYVFSFANDQTGDYVIPPISFSFFDPFSRKFKKISTDTLKFQIVPAIVNNRGVVERSGLRGIESSWPFVAGIGILILITAIFILKANSKKNTQPALPVKTGYLEKLNHATSLQLPLKEFCWEIQKLLGEINREFLLTQSQKQNLKAISDECQLLIYSDIESELTKDDIRKKAEDFLRLLDPDHSAYL
jgi:hypothetical protein